MKPVARATGTTSDLKLQIETVRPQHPSPSTQPLQEPAQEWANSTDKPSKRAEFTGNGPTYLARDSEHTHLR